MFWRVLFISIIFVFTFGIFGFQESKPLLNNAGLKHQIDKRTWVDSVMSTMTLDQKIGQFFMASAFPDKDLAHKQEISNLIAKNKIGGILFFKGFPTVQTQWVNEFQKASKIPLMISIDGEWGINMRLDSTIQYPRQLTLGAIQDNDLIYDMGKRIAQECKAVGININLAPVLDVNNNPNNPVINDRSFGEDKFNVTLKGLAYMQGMQDQNVMAVGKHFPGHGDTDADSHKTLPVIKHNMDRLDNLELYPFKTLFANGLMGVMAAHLYIPALDATPNLAVSLSKKVTTYLLKDSLGFKGLVFSDALNMKGVSAFYAPGEVDKIAFLAGNDILLYSEDIPKGIALIKKAVKDGEITEEYINERLLTVLSYKYELGLDKTPNISTLNIPDYLNNKEGMLIQRRLFEKAITVVKNDQKVIPLNKKFKTASLTLGTSVYPKLLQTLDAYTEITTFTETNYNLEKLTAFDQVIVPVYGMSRYSSKNYGFSDAELKILKDLDAKTKVILVLFGSPYSLKYFDKFKNIIVAYEENEITEIAVAKILAGQMSATGKLPVSAGKFKFGNGIDILVSSNLDEVLPSELNIKSGFLELIDSIMKFAIEDKATPGGQILAAKDGKIFYNKAFGNFDYENNQPVDLNSIYDVASITKVAATTLCVMKLWEENKLNLKQSVGHYLPEFDTTEIGPLTLESVMLHQSGLPGWIPFYLQTNKADTIYDKWYQTRPNEQFCIQVAENMYMCADSTGVIWNTIGESKISNEPKYRYSDIGFYLMKRIVERVSQKPIEQYVDETFYKPLGIFNTTFLPLDKFPMARIVPTENDSYFRKQKIQGHVHDMGAAMLGGISGHAGLFSTTNDLAVIMQMLLNKGTYNDVQFFKPSTVNYFTSAKIPENRRGLGFDKPVIEKNNSGPTSDFCSNETFGHQGFTGCVMWADPVYNVVYIFLSNRTYPTMQNNKLISLNVRTNIQDLIYRAIGVDSYTLN